MSDPKSYGEPVEEPRPVDDVVGRAEEGLADAEAARNDGVIETGEATVVETADGTVVETSGDVVVDSPAETVVIDDERPSAANGWAAETPAWATSAAASAPDDQPTVAYDSPAVTPSEPAVEVVEPAVVSAPAAAQPIFVQAPEAPRPRGNRAAAGAIGLLAALSFAVLYLAAWLGFGAIDGTVTADNVGEVALAALGTWSLWVPVVVFFIAFWLLGAIINRGRWGAWVVFGLLVGFASYGGHLLGALFQAPFWMLTAREGADLIEAELLAPLAIVAFVVGRELTIWFGAWVASRGKRVTELNVEAQREYERTLEAGPQLYRA